MGRLRYVEEKLGIAAPELIFNASVVCALSACCVLVPLAVLVLPHFCRWQLDKVNCFTGKETEEEGSLVLSLDFL